MAGGLPRSSISAPAGASPAGPRLPARDQGEQWTGCDPRGPAAKRCSGLLESELRRVKSGRHYVFLCQSICPTLEKYMGPHAMQVGGPVPTSSVYPINPPARVALMSVLHPWQAHFGPTAPIA